MEMCAITFIDTPNTAEQITYDVYLRCQSGGGLDFYLNRTKNDTATGNANHERGISTFIAECKGL
jgi:hypothetical protein